MSNHAFRARLAVFSGFVSQNVAIGLTFGAFGLMIEDIGQAFSVSRSVSSLGIALVTLASSLAAPVVGVLLDRWSIKWVMIMGCVFGAVGFWLASLATTMSMFLITYGLIVGVAVAATSNLSATKLASNWFMKSPGKAIGFVNLPLLIAVGPPVYSYIIGDLGWRGLLSIFAVVYLLLAVLLLFLHDTPESRDANGVHRGHAIDKKPDLWVKTLTDRRLWVIVIVAGIMFSGNIMLMTHIAVHATGQGIPVITASLLISINGAFAVLGAMFFGWLSDSYSPRYAITGNALAQAALWALLAVQSTFTGMAIIVAAIGICAGGAFPAISAFTREIFGATKVGTVLGQVTLLMIPFNFGIAPLAGYVFDVSGSYLPALALQAALCTAAAGLITLGWRWAFVANRPATANSIL